MVPACPPGSDRAQSPAGMAGKKVRDHLPVAVHRLRGGGQLRQRHAQQPRLGVDHIHGDGHLGCVEAHPEVRAVLDVVRPGPPPPGRPPQRRQSVWGRKGVEKCPGRRARDVRKQLERSRVIRLQGGDQLIAEPRLVPDQSLTPVRSSA